VRYSALLLGMILVLPCAIDAQESRSFVPLNVRVRLSAFRVGGEELRVVGNLAAIGRDSVVVLRDTDQTPSSVSIASLRRFEVSQGKQSRLRKGTLYGLLGGVLSGVASGIVICRDDTRPCGSDGENWTVQNLVALGVAGGLVGIGIGALVGSQIRSERWQRLTLQHLRVGSVQSSGMRVGFSLPLARSHDKIRRGS
jgi:hypothetical protein